MKTDCFFADYTYEHGYSGYSCRVCDETYKCPCEDKNYECDMYIDEDEAIEIVKQYCTDNKDINRSCHDVSTPHWQAGGFCSKCGYDITYDLDWGEKAPDNCPNCGARMV